MIGLYLHIPYCRSVCPYCDFVKQPVSGAVPRTFLDALCRELEAFEGDAEADTVFFGGGTPSLLEPPALERVLVAIGRRFILKGQGRQVPETTIEANPDDVTPALAAAWRGLGVNRVSLGVQSFDPEALAYLGRRHDAAGARRACGTVAERFDNWSMDLMFGFQPAAAWDATLEECVRFRPAHVSAYGLTYESGTPFVKRAHEAVEEDAYLEQYRLTIDALAGFEQYEVSNFARPGYACGHNLKYWRNETYAGFGPGAYSFLAGVRSRNRVRLEDYLADPGGKAEALTLRDAEIRVETLIQHFRLKEGLSKRAYLERFGSVVEAGFGPRIRGLIERGLLVEDHESVRPTPLGFELNNEIGLALVDVPLSDASPSKCGVRDLSLPQ